MTLTDEEGRDGEFESCYGTHKTSFQIDHKGRVFVGSEPADGSGVGEAVVVLNEAKDAEPVLRKIMALCSEALDHLTEET